MKKTEKMLTVMERRGEAAARELEKNFAPDSFTAYYHNLYALSPTPWLLGTLALGLFCHFALNVLWLAVGCYAVAAVMLFFLMDWTSLRVKVEGDTLLVSRLHLPLQRYDRAELTKVKLLPATERQGAKLILFFGDRKLTFYPELVGFEPLGRWANNK